MTATDAELATIHAVTANFDAIFTWDYKRSRPALGKLYEKAKTSQWNASTDLDWSIDVDPEKIGRELGGGGTDAVPGARGGRRLAGEALRRERVAADLGRDPELACSRSSCTANRARCICTARIVETVPWIDAKYYAATQVMDEARHVEVFARYLDEKLGCAVPHQRQPQRHPRRDPRATRAGTSRTSVCRSWSRASRSQRSA